MERAKLKGFQFDKTLSANFSSEQLTEINSLVSLSLFFPRFFRASSTIPTYLPHPSSSMESKFTFHQREGAIFDSFRFSSTDSRSVSVSPPPPERCKFAEFPGISSRLNAFNGSPVINNLLLSLVKDGQEVYSFLWINCYCY